MNVTNKIDWSEIELEIKNLIDETLKTRLMNNYSQDSQEAKDKSINETQIKTNKIDENGFVYAVFKDHVCFGTYINNKLYFKNERCDADKLLELRIFNKYFEVRVIYSFEKDEFLYRYIDDCNDSGDLFIYEEQHYLDAEWQDNGEFGSQIRSFPELPFPIKKSEDNHETKILDFKDKDLTLLIKTYIKFDDDGSPEVADWRLAGFKAGGNEVECNG